MSEAPELDEATRRSLVAAVGGPVHVVGAGLLGTSVGLAARRAGLEVWLSDTSPEHVRTATGLGAGTPVPDEGAAALTVVAVPPDHVAEVVRDALERGGVVTDVASVKSRPLADLERRAPGEVSRYVGSHPMAGSERSGPLAATAALFDGRPWAVTPHAGSEPGAVAAVEALARLCGAETVRLTPLEHDRAVARTSHLPHLLAALTAGQLADAAPEHLSLSGQGVRDVTRIAAGDPALWRQILRANQPAVSEVLREVEASLHRLVGVIESGDDAALGEILGRGVAGTRVIPGKHGGPALPTQAVYVAVPDHPGELARLFADVGEIGVNIEDLRIDHDPGRPVGLVELLVAEDAAAGLREALGGRDWVTHR
ncbi:prephenate dehydrogenase [Marmoricola sp. Leaf446]|uniref:prephenate dehydrogenase n=1 Tax=Marmoricola sp. Leaf446 TaxID=1736379 RepID=UPI000701CDA8|nr:prephenate dehydrogenase [Marmoricola sp. Leaf446]KQT94758.1 prephenate dehydrogenase [Marmoricola sp. Leaf446]